MDTKEGMSINPDANDTEGSVRVGPIPGDRVGKGVVADADHSIGADPDAGMRRYPKGWGRLLAACALALATLFVMTLVLGVALGVLLAGNPSGLSAGMDAQALLSSVDVETLIKAMTVAHFAGGMLAVLSMVLLGGRELVRLRATGFGFALRASMWLLIFAGVVTPCLDIVLELSSGFSLAEMLGSVSASWPADLLLVATFCLSVGLIEEGVFRGLLLEGLLARMGTTRRGVVGAVVIMSLVFGAVHVVGSNVSDGLVVVQAVLKTIQAAILGFVFGVILLKTRNVWCAIAMHAAFRLPHHAAGHRLW